MKRKLSILLIVALAIGLFAGFGTVAAAEGERVKIEILQHGWVIVPNDEGDPYKAWLDEKFNCDITMTNAGSDFENQYLVRFASGEEPDMIALSKEQLNKLYDQGVVVEDWTPYLDKLPTMAANMNPDAKALFTTADGKLKTVPGLKEPNIWTWMIRRDWLDALGLKVPTTAEELLDVARSFTNNDPDGNGKKDTYAFTSAGGNLGFGEIGQFQNMFGPDGFYYAEGADKANHPIMDGNNQKFLDWMRIVLDEKLIDPDWYTIGWEERKPKLFNGDYGFCYYPGVLVFEAEAATGNTGKTIDRYDAMPMPAGAENGGKYGPVPPYPGYVVTVSKKAEADTKKFETILKIMDGTSYPNEGFWARRWGIGIEPGMKKQDAGNGYTYINVLGALGQYWRSNLDSGHRAAWDWGYAVSSRGDLVIEGSTDEITKATDKNIELNSAAGSYPSYHAGVMLLNLDPQYVEDAGKVYSEFCIKYVLRETDDYESFRQAWLNAGGQALIDQATEQYKALGYIK